MARPKKNGLDYFPLDTDFFYADQKIRALRRKYGCDGIAVYLYLLCAIYRQGYYLVVTGDLEEDISEDLRLPVNKVRQIVAYLTGRSADAERENRSLFQMIVQENTAGTVKALTSISIQRRYAATVKGGKSTGKGKEFWILNSGAQLPGTEKPEKEQKTDSFDGKNPDKQNKTKEKKTKQEERKQDGTKTNETAADETLQRDVMTLLAGSNVKESEIKSLIRYAKKIEMRDRIYEAVSLAVTSGATNISAYTIAVLKTWKGEWE